MSNAKVGSAGKIPEELKVLTSISKGPKLMEEISSDAGVPLEACKQKVLDLIGLGLVVIEHDSDLYGHEFLKYRLPSRQKFR